MFQGTLTLLVRAVRLDTRMLFPHLFRFLFVGIIYLPLVWAHSERLRLGAPGLYVFTGMAYLNFVFITLAAVSFFATAITEEKEEETLGLLKMAGVGPVAILLGKSTSRLIAAKMLLLVQLPFTLLAITLGGVTLPQIVAAYVALFAYLVFAANLGLFCSVMCKQSGNASGLTGFTLLAFFLGVPLMRFMLTLWTQYGTLSPNGFVARSLDTILEWLSAASVFSRLQSTTATGFAESPFSYQVISNLSAAAVLFLLAWASFDFFTRDLRTATPGRGILFRRSSRLRRFGLGRAWHNALAWKDYNFVAGGKPMFIAKIILYGCLLTLLGTITSYANKWQFDRRDFVRAGIPIMILFGGVEFCLYASRIFHEEVKWKTLSATMMLPHSTAYIAYSKLVGCLLAMIPVAGFFIVVLMFDGHTSGQFLDEVVGAEGIFTVMLFSTFLHLTALLSLYVKRGALAVAIAIMIGTWMCCATPFMLTNARVDEKGILIMLNFSLWIPMLGMQYMMGVRLEELAGK